MSKLAQELFRSAPVAVMHNNVEYAFRQDSDFFYLTGFNEPEGSGSFSATSFRTPFCPVCPTKGTREGNLDWLPIMEWKQQRAIWRRWAYTIAELDEATPVF